MGVLLLKNGVNHIVTLETFKNFKVGDYVYVEFYNSHNKKSYELYSKEDENTFTFNENEKYTMTTERVFNSVKHLFDNCEITRCGLYIKDSE